MEPTFSFKVPPSLAKGNEEQPKKISFLSAARATNSSGNPLFASGRTFSNKFTSKKRQADAFATEQPEGTSQNKTSSGFAKMERFLPKGNGDGVAMKIRKIPKSVVLGGDAASNQTSDPTRVGSSLPSRFKFVKKPEQGDAPIRKRLTEKLPPLMEQKTIFSMKADRDPPPPFSHSVLKPEVRNPFGGMSEMPNPSDRRTPETHLMARVGHERAASSPPRRGFAPIIKKKPIVTGSKEERDALKQLRSLYGRKCPTETERYHLLDERDKIICKIRDANSLQIQKLQPSDQFCTEKERYMRIVQKRASAYECDENGKVDPKLMIKEYARSAADQYQPLAYELRSEEMMVKTLDYLIATILDELPEAMEQRTQWYDFLWSRTRAVRKEVTQLSMTGECAVNLVERCTRMHILCGYLLCTLEIEQFDQKMNDENLGKCLQTLRHLYEDAERSNVFYESEAEFRAYDVMLHLNDPNVLTQVLSWRSEVREAKPVGLALQLAASMQNNNYCRFFRLLKEEGTYLQCCVAHKFFDQVRSRAVNVMLSSYGRNASFPLTTMVKILAFDSEEDAKDQMAVYGVYINDMDSDQFVLNKEYMTKETVSTLHYRWIDEKRDSKYSQVVYGNTKFFYTPINIELVNSFDSHGKYVSDRIVEDLLDGEVPAVNADTSEDEEEPDVKPVVKTTFSFARKEETSEEKREKKIEEIKQRISQSMLEGVVRNLVNEEVMKEKMRRKQQELLEQRQKEEEAKRAAAEKKRKQREQFIEATVRRLVEKVEKEVVEKESKRLAVEVVKAENQQRIKNIATELTEKLWSTTAVNVVDNIVRKNVAMIVRDEKDYNTRITEGMERLRTNLHTAWLRQFWDRWRYWAKEKKLRRIRRSYYLRRSVPLWESQDERTVALYTSSSDQTTSLSSSNKVDPFKRRDARVAKVARKRKERLARAAVKKWRTFTAERVFARNFNGFFDENHLDSYIGGEKIMGTVFKFAPPQRAGRKRSATILQEVDDSCLEKRNKDEKFDADVTIAKRMCDECEWQNGDELLPVPNIKPVVLPRFEIDRREADGMRRELESRKAAVVELSQSADDLMSDIKKFEQDLQQMMSDLHRPK